VTGHVIGGKYEVVRQLGEGGMGAVYEARHLGTGRRVAVKVIGAQALAIGAEAVQRFDREARASGAIDSEHVVQVLDSGIDDATQNPYMVMELLSGEDLQQLLRRTGPLSPDAALRVIAQACIGLHKAHLAGIVHRDLKSANLFLGRRDQGGVIVKLLDFGIAKVRADQFAASGDHGLTRTGAMLGSPLYMSPEQAKGSKDIDHRSDIWSLGVVLYEALTGAAPNANLQTIGELIIAICSEPPRPIQEVAPWVPANVAAIVHTALSADPAARYASAADMQAAIVALLPDGTALGESMLAPVTPQMRRTTAPRLAMTTATSGQVVGAATAAPVRAKRRWIAPLAFAAVAAAGAVGFVAMRGPDAAKDAPKDTRPALAPAPVAPTPVAPTPAPPPPAPTPVVTTPQPQAKTVEVAIAPADATIEVDGTKATAPAGKLALTGPVGSVHHVHVEQAGRSTTADVVIAETGAVPSRVELAAPVRVPAHKPTHTTSKTTKTTPSIDRSFD
jgi:serine/threonine-protein kinase